jgi:alpha-1,3-rhamnosyl/mannosyltransferase
MTSNYVLDLRTVTDHFPGIGRYGFNLARAMVPLLAPSEQLILLRNPTQPSAWDLTLLAGEGVRVVDVPLSPFYLRQQWAIPRLLHCLADFGDPLLYHSPYYLMPYRPGVPTLLTCYDLIPLVCPHYFSPAQRLIYRLANWLALSVARVVLVISEATKADLVRHFRVDPRKVVVTPLAADPHFKPQPPAAIAGLRQKYALPDRYVLYFGSNKPHKNLVRLVEAWKIVEGRAQSAGCRLVIAGAWDMRYPEALERAKALGLGERVVFLGPVAEAELPALYAGAELFVFPSLYEGFGLPVLEAMACGTPVVCSNRSSLPEVTGDAALLVDPHDVGALAAAIGQAMGDAELRRILREKGLAQAVRFSWERTAQATLAIYQEVLRGSRPNDSLTVTAGAEVGPRLKPSGGRYARHVSVFLRPSIEQPARPG